MFLIPRDRIDDVLAMIAVSIRVVALRVNWDIDEMLRTRLRPISTDFIRPRCDVAVRQTHTRPKQAATCFFAVGVSRSSATHATT